MLFIFSTPVLIRHLWQHKTVVFLHWCLICVFILICNEWNHRFLRKQKKRLHKFCYVAATSACSSMGIFVAATNSTNQTQGSLFFNMLSMSGTSAL